MGNTGVKMTKYGDDSLKNYIFSILARIVNTT